jgi:hypothetical protein
MLVHLELFGRLQSVNTGSLSTIFFFLLSSDNFLPLSYIFSTETIARVGRGLDPEARAALGSPGFEPGLVVTFAVL